MTGKKTGQKGYATEELIRAYFLGAGFFVLRAVPFRLEGVDLTDIDLWIYERSATLARRRTIIDVKDKRLPQAAERLFFVKGLAEVLQVEGAGVATGDNRPALRELARKHGLVWLDGADLQRFKSSTRLANQQRLTEEELIAQINGVDSGRASRHLKDRYISLKSAVGNRFGAPCANTALESAQFFATLSLQAHADSPAAKIAVRLTFLSVCIAAAALDFLSADVALRPSGDRLRYITNALRYGDDIAGTEERLKWTEAAITEFIPDGAVIARAIRQRFTSALKSVPAEGLAEVVVRAAATERLFESARMLESAAFAVNLPGFDDLQIEAKSFLGAVLDFCGIERAAFAARWTSSGGIGGVEASAVIHPEADGGSSAEVGTDATAPKDDRLL